MGGASNSHLREERDYRKHMITQGRWRIKMRVRGEEEETSTLGGDGRRGGTLGGTSFIPGVRLTDTPPDSSSPEDTEEERK